LFQFQVNGEESSPLPATSVNPLPKHFYLQLNLGLQENVSTLIQVEGVSPSKLPKSVTSARKSLEMGKMRETENDEQKIERLEKEL